MTKPRNRDPLFIAAPFFMSRTPFFPIQDYFNLIEKGPLLSVFSKAQQSMIMEALAIASPSLYEAILSYKTKKIKKQNQIDSALLKYLLRMTTRSTPFGLFSFVSEGSWKNESSFYFDVSLVQKRARPDMEWMLDVIDGICSDPSLFSHLYVKKNPLIYESGGRVYLHHFRKKNEEEKNKILSIRSSFLTKAIFEIAKQPINVGKIVDNLVSRFPFLEPDKILRVIRQLLIQQFLSCTLLPSLLTSSPFDDLLTKLSSLPLSHNLDKIAFQLSNYNKISPGKGLLHFLQIQSEMKKISQSKNYLQVDAALKESKISLSTQVKEELEVATEALWKICTLPSTFSGLRDYHKKFLEKYGVHRKISLFELFNEDIGLGFPRNDNTPASSSSSSHEKKWIDWLKKEWNFCIRSKKNEIEIPISTVNEMIDGSNKNKAILSFDLNCEVIADSPSQIDSGNFLLQILFVSWQGGNTLGRFSEILGNKTQNRIKNFLSKEEALEPNTNFSNSSFISSLPRLANVMTSPNHRKNAIDLEGEEKISLDDIQVGANFERLYLTLKDSSEELIVTTGNMLNNIYTPPVLRFLQDVSRFKYQPIFSFPWFELEGNFFLPRVRLNRTVFSPAQWKVNLFQLSLTNNDSLQRIENSFTSWADLWEMPRYVYITQGDNRILLDRNNPLHLQQILLNIRKGDDVKLVEKIGQKKGQWVCSKKGNHLSEFTIPFLKNKKFTLSEIDLSTNTQAPISTDCRWKLPGTEWVYVKCYLGTENENRFLLEKCAQFSYDVMMNEMVTGWFFVRYNDPSPHLRIRFKCKNKQLFPQFFSDLCQWASSLIHSKYINDFSIGTYQREVERYGGKKLIDFAENIFCEDTLTTIQLVKGILSKQTHLPVEAIGALSLISLLKDLGLGLEEQLYHFSLSRGSKEELSGFRDLKPILVLYGQSILDNTLQTKKEFHFFCKATLKRRKALRNFTINMQKIQSIQQLSSPTNSIIDSLIHMHCNRLLGREQKKELKTRLYASHTLNILREKQRAQQMKIRSL